MLIFRISSVPAKFWNEFYKTLVYSPASYPLPFLTLRKDSDAEDSTLDIPINSKRFSENLPFLPYYVKKITVSGEQGLYFFVLHRFTYLHTTYIYIYHH